MNYKIFTSESVAAGHPDKICDQISDAILDETIKVDPESRVAVEALVTKNKTILAGELTCNEKLDLISITRNVIKDLGYTKKEYGFWFESPIEEFIHQQSLEIAEGVNKGGAGDQGMMFGYATNETPEFMPLPIMLAHQLVMAMDKSRQLKIIPYLKPDGKSEVVIAYENGLPKEVIKVILAVPYEKSILKEMLKEDLFNFVIQPVLSKYKHEIDKEKVIVNGAGEWFIGGPASDTGLTGRKIIIDTYGGMARHGGGCFSGKDPTKVDRSGAYAARFIAKNIIAAKLATRVEVQIAYVIGKKEPIAKSLETFGTNDASIKDIEDFAWNLIDLSIKGITKKLGLKQPIYRDSAVYGHFGRDQFPWEKILV